MKLHHYSGVHYAYKTYLLMPLLTLLALSPSVFLDVLLSDRVVQNKQSTALTFEQTLDEDTNIHTDTGVDAPRCEAIDQMAIDKASICIILKSEEKPISDIHICIEKNAECQEITTDSQGKAILSNLSIGEVKIIVTSKEYKSNVVWKELTSGANYHGFNLMKKE